MVQPVPVHLDNKKCWSTTHLVVARHWLRCMRPVFSWKKHPTGSVIVMTPLHKIEQYSGLRRLLGHITNISVLWTNCSEGLPSIDDEHVINSIMTEEEWTKHRRAGNSENAYLTKTRQTCNCESKWARMEAELLKHVVEVAPVRIVVYSFYRHHGVEGFFDYLRDKWECPTDGTRKTRLKYQVNGVKVRCSLKYDKTLKWFNKDGPEAKILLLSSKDAIGISLKNVRWVHLMEPQWSDATDQQAIGRATRKDSHDLTESIVHVYRWISKPLRGYTMQLSADSRVRLSMLKKKQSNDKLLRKLQILGGRYLRKVFKAVTIKTY